MADHAGTAVTDWLLDSDPAIRWQVLRDLLDAPADEVAAERARVATEGWGAAFVAARDDDGQWAGGACFPQPERVTRYQEGDQPWIATQPVLVQLADLGLDPSLPWARETIDLVAEHCVWEYDGARFFDGEVEACINGRTIRIGAYFDHDVDKIVEFVLGDQLEDGGWNCYREQGATVSSVASTINVVEGLLAWERATGRDDTAEARRQGEEYLLERGLFKRRSTGEVADPAWLDLVYPCYWHHDVLRGLEHFRELGGSPDPRLGDALEHLRGTRRDDGRWLLDGVHPGETVVDMEQVGEPSRWNTLRALRVLRWADGS
jgi:hypothetical protein